ncbi:class I SAM-dependent methyltransferase [Streptomyces tsukubensis]|uniref:class I SAM-dependent methyltransferase n=1 Tax=Streptomyces tsukubensis TaxID=83656 RepID=UPI00344F9AB1
MADEKFENPVLAEVYDPLEAARPDLDAYLRMAEEFGARRILDIGCGTGVFALLLADRGLDVTGLDPAAASLDVARAKPGAGRVRWIHGDITALPPLDGFDLITMTANVAQAIDSPALWHATLRGARTALRPGGRLVFETRDPARRAWESWNRDESYEVVDVPGRGEVESWYDVLDAGGPLVTFRQTCVFRATGAIVTSDSTLRFRTREEVAADLAATGFPGYEVRDAPDRPGREFVFVTRRPPLDPARD